MSNRDISALKGELGSIIDRLEEHCKKKDDEIAALKAQLSLVEKSHTELETRVRSMRRQSRRASITQMWKHISQASVLSQKVDFSQAALETLLASLFTVFTNDSVDEVIVDIISQATGLLHAEECAFYFVGDDDELELFVPPEDVEGDTSRCSTTPVAPNIAEISGSTLLALNIEDAYEDARFDQSEDEGRTSRTKEILALPIEKKGGKLLGVTVLRNKTAMGAFTSMDESLLSAFTTYCAIALHNASLLEEITAKEAQNQVALELISYHTHVEDSHVEELLALPLPLMTESPFKGMDQFTWDAYTLTSADDSVLFVVRMFEEMNLMEIFDIPRDKLFAFVATVRNNYRDVPYHNWHHAISVFHQMFSFSRLCDFSVYFEDHEILALMIASLCHDIDHRGENNAYQTETHSELAKLYTSSVMERHHFSHMLLILSNTKTKIFCDFEEELYRATLDVMKDLILATDLALHFPAMKTIKSVGLTAATYEKSKPEHRRLLMNLLMTCSDLNTSTKPMEVHRSVTDHIYEEFFKQGDEEKKFGQSPIDMMNRETAYIPKIQVGFFDFIAVPTYKLVAEIVPQLQPVLDSVMSNRDSWAEMEFAEEGERSTHLPTV